MMNKIRRIGSIYILFLLLMPGMMSCEENNRELEEVNQRCDSIATVLTQKKHEADSLRKLIQNGEVKRDYPIYFGKEFEGIEDPEEFVESSLRQNPEKIPLEPVLGGTMEFRNVQVLTESWVLGQYDDGHIQGTSIYRYSLGDEGQLDFETVTSQQPE